jgi:hypothetical protein
MVCTTRTVLRKRGDRLEQSGNSACVRRPDTRSLAKLPNLAADVKPSSCCACVRQQPVRIFVKGEQGELE